MLCVNVKPNQRFDRVERRAGREDEGAPQWTIRIREAAVDGRANSYLVGYLSELLGLPKAKVSLKRGQSSRVKWIEIDAEAADVVEALNRHAVSGR